MRHLKCIEKFTFDDNGVAYVIVSVRLVVDERFERMRLERFRADAPIESIVHYLQDEWDADRVSYQQMMFPPH